MEDIVDLIKLHEAGVGKALQENMRWLDEQAAAHVQTIQQFWKTWECAAKPVVDIQKSLSEIERLVRPTIDIARMMEAVCPPAIPMDLAILDQSWIPQMEFPKFDLTPMIDFTSSAPFNRGIQKKVKQEETKYLDDPKPRRRIGFR
jgi:hypothetical protein